MGINELAKIANIDISGLGGVKAGGSNTAGKLVGESEFGSVLDGAMQLLSDTNNQIANADQLALDFTLGKVDSIHEVMIAQEKASMALQYTVQLRDKFLDAYNEIMRMQI
ncbi:MAG: flagellar hook-basal body complex protein FliE [Vallitaleaceae bacterium]|jgi:flagellar hook-basal body complex protein FliE|nr:flagellar hook-basal body complex protein FliE [Vallitaleaceae bacterium]